MTPLFITGGTGFTGRRLIRQLVARGYDVTVLVRSGSEHKLPPGVRAIIADPFDAKTFVEWIPKGAVFVQLLGASKPWLRKKEAFREVDLRSVQASAEAAASAGVSHFVYLSAATEEPNLLKDFQQVRREGEAVLAGRGFACTFVRPWRVWHLRQVGANVLLPLYVAVKRLAARKKRAPGCTLVSAAQVLRMLLKIVEEPPPQRRVVEVRHIKTLTLPAY